MHLNGPMTQAVIHPPFPFDGDGSKDDQAGGPRVKKFRITAAVYTCTRQSRQEPQRWKHQ